MPTAELVPASGNHARWFPYMGAFGVTDVFLQGEVRTKLQEDNKPLKCTHIQVRVRCYEAENPSGGIKMKRDKMNVVYERYSDTPVWEKEPNQHFGELAETSHPFRIVIPRINSGISTVTYKSYRAWWQIEAILHYPKSSNIHGSRLLLTQQIPLRRFNHTPSPLPPLAWSSSTSPASTPLASTSKLPPAPTSTRSIRYSISLLPTSAPGPGDSLDFALRFHRDDPSISLRKVQLSLDRTLILNPIKVSPTNSDDEFDVTQLTEEDDSVWSPPSSTTALHDDFGAPAVAPGRPASRGLSSVFRRGSSAGASTGKSPLPSPSYTPGAEVNSYFAALPTPSASTSGSNNSTPTNVGSHAPQRIERYTVHNVELDHVQWDGETKVSLVVPQGKGNHRYSTGESMKTKHIDVRFTVGVKITLRHRNGAAETLELEPQVIQVMGDRLPGPVEHKKVTEAEQRLEKRYAQPAPSAHASHRSPPPVRTSLGARRASNFTLTVNIDQQSTPAPPLPSPSAVSGPNSDGKRRNSWFAAEPRSIGTRRRSEQSDGPLGAPVKSRARFGAAPSPPSASSSTSSSGPTSSQGDTVVPFAGSGYVSSALSRPPLHSEYRPRTPGSPDFLITPTPSTFAVAIAHADQRQEQQRLGTFPLATPPSQLPHHSSSGSSADSGHPRLPRRSGGPSSRSNPYSSAHRPRSAGALSTISQRSNLSSQDGSSIRSFSSASSAGFVRESSGPLPSTNTSSHLMMLLGGEDLPSLSLEPKKRRSKPPHQQYLSPPAENFTSGVIPVPHPLSPESSSSHSVADSPPQQSTAAPTGLTAGASVPPSPSLSFTGDDDDDRSSATSSPPIGSFDAPPSPAIDFQAFSLAARQPSSTISHSPFALTDSQAGATGVDSATRAEIAPWSVTEVSPFDLSPRRGNVVAKGMSRAAPPSGGWSPPPSASSGMARTSSSGKISVGGEYLGVVSPDAAPRRKSSGGFGLFNRGESSHAHEEGHESPGKEGSRWGFLRRGSRA